MSQVSISRFDPYRGGSGRFTNDLNVVSVIPKARSTKVPVTVWTPLLDVSKLLNALYLR
jgi:hypothetical protein